MKGYKGRYQVSSMGRVKSLKRVTIMKDGRKLPVKEHILKPFSTKKGYLLVDLSSRSCKRKTISVHRLVCAAFHENPENKPCVNHINEDKADNRACNLDVVSDKEDKQRMRKYITMKAAAVCGL